MSFKDSVYKNINLLCLLLFFACTEIDSDVDTDDTQAPIITMLESSPVAGEGVICGVQEDKVITALTGSEILLNLEFTDNRNLSQYKIDIHNNFDCHSHGRLAAAAWQLLEIENITGTNVDVIEELTVPQDALAGDYHLQILCLDELGNEAEPLIYSIKIENSIDNEPPLLSLTQPSSTSIAVAKGDDLAFIGTVTDNHSLNNGKIEITYTNAEGTEFFPLQEFFSETQGKEADFDLNVVVPPSAATGNHTFKIRVYDTYNNFAEEVFEVDFN